MSTFAVFEINPVVALPAILVPNITFEKSKWVYSKGNEK
jgi:hypothetical protein